MISNRLDPKVIGSLLNSKEGEEAFLSSIDTYVAELREMIADGKLDEAMQQVVIEISSLKIMADRVRATKYAKTVEIIEEAKAKFKLLL